MPQENNVELMVTIKNSKPIELVDLGKSFEALGHLYESFVYEKGYEPTARNAKLYLVNVRRGSIIAELKAFLDQASFVVDHIEVLAGFLTNLNDLIEFFRVQSSIKNKSELPSRTEAARFAQIFEPIAKDGASQINFTIKGNRAPVTVNNIIVKSERANAIQNNVRRYLGPEVPRDGSFSNEVLYLQQMRGDKRSSVGDRGVIEKFSMRPVKLFFMSPEVKAAIVDRPRNPFKSSYVVDGIVSTAKGEPALYKIMSVHDTIMSPRIRKLSRKGRGQSGRR